MGCERKAERMRVLGVGLMLFGYNFLRTSYDSVIYY